MPLIGAYNSMTPGFLTPRVGTGAPGLAAPQMSEEDRRAMTQRLFNTRYSENRGMNVFEKTASWVAASGVDLVDSVYGNNLIPGTERGDVWNFVGDYGSGMGEELKGFYERNQSGIELTSGIVGAVGTAYVAGAMVLPRLASAAASSTMISSSRLWQAGSAANAAVRQRMLQAQATAAANAEAFGVWGTAAGRGAARAYALNRAGRLAGIAAVEEAAIAGVMNANEAIWADELSENLLWAGLGIGVGGTLGAFGARAEMRKIANSPEMVARKAEALDPQALTQSLEDLPSTSFLQSTSGAQIRESAHVTALSLEARQAVPTGASPELRGKFDQMRVQRAGQALHHMQRIASKGAEGIPNSRFEISGEVKENLQGLLHEDPMALFGLDSLALPREGVDKALIARSNLIDELMRMNEASSVRKGREMQTQQPLALIDGQWLPANTPEAQAWSHYTPGQLKHKQAKGTHEFSFEIDSGKTLKVNESLDAKGFASRPIVDRMQIAESLSLVMNSMRKAGQAYALPANPTWMQLDAAIEYARRGGDLDWGQSSIRSLEDAELQSLKLKAEAIGDDLIGSYWDRQAWNLPLPNATERIYDAAGDSFRAVLQAAKDGATLPEIRDLYSRMREAHGFDLRTGAANGKPEPLYGNLFNFNRTEEGAWKPTVLGFFAEKNSLQPDIAGINAYWLAENKAARFHHLTNGDPEGGIIPELTQRLHALPQLQDAMNVRGLTNEQVTGIGGAPTQLLGEALTREFRARDSRTMLAAAQVAEAMTKATDQFISRILSENLGTSVARLNASTAQAKASKALLNQFASNSQGWDLKPGVVPLGGDRYGFGLAKTQQNAARLGEEIADDAILVNPRTNAAIVVDSLGLEFLEGFQDIARRLLADKNRLRVAQGMKPLNRKEWYVPPWRTKGMHVAFTFDAQNNLVPGGAIIAKTRAEMDSLIARKNKELTKGQVIRTREAATAASDLVDRAAMDWLDPGTAWAPGKSSKGTLAPDTVNPHAIGDILTWAKEQAEQNGVGLMRVLFESQLEITRARAATERLVKGQKTGATQAQSLNDNSRTIWDEYEATILNRKLGAGQQSISGGLMHPIEKFMNAGIEKAWPAMRWMSPAQLGQWTGDLLGHLGVQKFKPASTFYQLSQQLGPFSPYKDAVDYAEQTLKVIRPPEVKEISEKVNWLSSALLLRWLEIPHAAMNMIGVITTLPSIVQNGRAPISAAFDVAGKKMNIIDAGRIMIDAGMDHFRASRRADWDFMVKNGDTTQQVAEFNKQLSLVTDQPSWKRVMFGSGSKAGAKGAAGVFNEKGIDGLISAATDTTEGWSRSWSHFVGLRLADMNGITGMEARHNFAREIANAAIANYNPVNRPELFQSAFGSMFGLFMSWMQSYNQRLFRWMETGDYAAVGRQLAMQTALFGVASNPGWNYLEKTLLASGAGQTTDGREATIVDHIYARFGPSIGSTIVRGGLADLGVVLYTRGDMNYRDVTLDPSRLAAGVNVVQSGVSAVMEAMQSVASQHALDDSGALSEIFARHMPNRVMKGIASVVLNEGRDIDARGQIVSETQDFFETAIRMTGLRSTRQQGEIEAFYASKQMQQREAARMDILRGETRALLRQKDWEPRLQEVFTKYLRAGGSPAHFRTWIRDQIRQSGSSRGTNDLIRAMKNERNFNEVWRYNMYGAN